MVFQPILDAKSGHVRGFEALARWYNPDLGHVPPNVFIETAEQMGMISRLSEVLLRKALVEAVKWPADLGLSFNISAKTLATRTSILRLLSIIDRSGFPPERFIFEITESAVMKDFDVAISNLEVIKATGVRLSLDDFGTGYSSLSYVQKLPVDILKVDRAFVQDICTNKASLHILRSVEHLCSGLNKTCIVEGVETQEQVEAIMACGLNFMQGYFFSRPLAAEDVIAFVEEANAASEAA